MTRCKPHPMRGGAGLAWCALAQLLFVVPTRAATEPLRPAGMPSKLQACTSEDCFAAALRACTPARYPQLRTLAEDGARHGPARPYEGLSARVMEVEEACWPVEGGCAYVELRRLTAHVPEDQVTWTQGGAPRSFWSVFLSGEAAWEQRKTRVPPALPGRGVAVAPIMHVVGADALTAIVGPSARPWLERAAKPMAPKDVPEAFREPLQRMTQGAPLVLLQAFVPKDVSLVGVRDKKTGDFNASVRVWSAGAATFTLPIHVMNRDATPAILKTEKLLKPTDVRALAAHRVYAMRGGWAWESGPQPKPGTILSAFTEPPENALLVDAMCTTAVGSVRPVPFMVTLETDGPQASMLYVQSDPDGTTSGSRGVWSPTLTLPPECSVGFAAYVAARHAEAVSEKARAHPAVDAADALPEECRAQIKAARVLAKRLYVQQLAYNAENDRYTSALGDLDLQENQGAFTVRVDKATATAFSGRVTATPANPFPNVVVRVTQDGPARDAEPDPCRSAR